MLSPGTTYPEREYKIVEVAELTKGRVQKEKIRGPGENSGTGSTRSKRRS